MRRQFAAVTWLPRTPLSIIEQQSDGEFTFVLPTVSPPGELGDPAALPQPETQQAHAPSVCDSLIPEHHCRAIYGIANDDESSFNDVDGEIICET